MWYSVRVTINTNYGMSASPIIYANTYDTWSLHHEGPGPWNSYVSYKSSPTPTSGYSGINGFDDDGVNGVDDPGELPISAPVFSSAARRFGIEDSHL